MSRRQPRYSAEQAAEILSRMTNLQEDASENEDDPDNEDDSGDEFVLNGTTGEISDSSESSGEELIEVQEAPIESSDEGETYTETLDFVVYYFAYGDFPSNELNYSIQQ